MNVGIRNRQRKASFQGQQGLTLVEIIVVLVILSVLIGFLTGGLFSQGEKAKAKINELQMQKVKQAIGQYQLMYNQLPPDINSLAGCPQGQTACVPITDESTLKDAWDVPFQYSLENGGRSYILKSLGSDRAPGGTGVAGDPTLTGP